MKIDKGILVLGGLLLAIIGLFAGIAFSKDARTLRSVSKKVETGSTNINDNHHNPSPADSKIFENLLGKEAPDFSLESFDGRKVSLSSLRGKNVVLFFNEGLMCYPACWEQISAFVKDTRFNPDETVVLSIVTDTKDKWAEAVRQMPELAKATVLLDSSQEVSKTYGTLSLASSMHKGQLPGHTYVVIDKEGTVRELKDDEEMLIRNDELASIIEKF